MITIFNRKEVCVCQSMERFSEIRNLLMQSNIKYTYRIMDRNSSNVLGSQRSRAGTLGQNINALKMYYVYVHKKDYDTAIGLLKGR
ncbi:hypothetical protein [Tissierella sp. Yu-01]|uniref:hypothetical protein n=1 Tax=Tissierella sp. Yu-01 TaxID=3035694 RepID=UPI00240D2FB5|nr:hypothetical protein [Tissierella sp. Yu-01]WFA10164.1 hypothetical protein P3962_06330 [Tissierella sp. Yu-01]